MKLTDAERAKVDTIRARLDNHDLRFDMYLYAGKHGLERHPAVDDLRAALSIIDRLSQEPEVVRCGECKNSSRIASDLTGRMRHCWNGRGRNNGDGLSRVHQDDYCDEGKRKEGT